jgi:CheY-like chemotaxis protein
MAQVGLLEDNTRIAKLCATMLQYAGHQVTIYEHPRKCLQALLPQLMVTDSSIVSYEAITPSSLPVDVLILDLHLPDIDGIEVLRHLRSSPRTLILPLIFCTAASRSEVARAMSVAPDAGLVEKPFKLQSLMSAVNRALNTQKSKIIE